MDKQINHDKFYAESKTRTHKLTKLPDDGDNDGEVCINHDPRMTLAYFKASST